MVGCSFIGCLVGALHAQIAPFGIANNNLALVEDGRAGCLGQCPTDGYLDNYLVEMNPDGPIWFDTIQKMFFLMSRNGQIYSKFSLDFGINDDPKTPCGFSLKAWLTRTIHVIGKLQHHNESFRKTERQV